jgi:type IV pilus assembly protein PilB
MTLKAPVGSKSAPRRAGPASAVSAMPEGFDPSRLLPDPEAIRLIPRGVAVRYLLAPLAIEPNVVHLAMQNPSDLEALDMVEVITNRQPVVVACSEEQVRELIQRLYGTTSTGAALEATVEETARLSREKSDGTEMPVVRLVDQILAEAVRSGATDFHAQPEEGELVVRFRIDGLLRTAFKLPSEVHLPLVTRIKVLANLDISERRLPQDGSIELVVGDRRIDLRVSSFPTIHGENLVLRILDHSRVRLGFEDLGFAPVDIERLHRIIARPNGIVLVTGPTGAGKTTTLYAALQQVDAQTRNVMTLEDPVEYRLAGIRQAQILEKAGFTFAVGLRALLRQDPDVLLVGEIRDGETAGIAARAALTGHLVLSTLHTMSAVGAISRLRELGLEDYLLASTVCAIVGQRLVRRNCPGCTKPVEATAAERRFLGLPPEEPLLLQHGEGCAACGRTGYAGRRAVYELFEVSPTLRRLIGEGAGEPALLDAAAREGFASMRSQGVQKLREGLTTLEELARVVV